jgi:hypothetical protein
LDDPPWNHGRIKMLFAKNSIFNAQKSSSRFESSNTRSIFHGATLFSPRFINPPLKCSFPSYCTFTHGNTGRTKNPWGSGAETPKEHGPFVRVGRRSCGSMRWLAILDDFEDEPEKKHEQSIGPKC